MVSHNKQNQQNINIKESRKKIENVDAVLARVKGKLLPSFLQDGTIVRLAKHVPAKAILVKTFRTEEVEGLRVRKNYPTGPRGSNLV